MRTRASATGGRGERSSLTAWPRRVAAVLATDTLGWAAPDTPVYEYHADTDEIVPVAQDDALARAWCAHGATVQVVRDLIGEHAEEAIARQGSVLAFLASRFAGAPANNTC